MFCRVSTTRCFVQGVHKLGPLVNSEHSQDDKILHISFVFDILLSVPSQLSVFVYLYFASGQLIAFLHLLFPLVNYWYRVLVFYPYSTIGISVFIYFAPGELIVFVHLYFALVNYQNLCIYYFDGRNPPSVDFPFPPALVLNLPTADQDC